MGRWIVSLDELEPSHLAAWRELARQAVEPNPFFEPEFLLPSARHLATSPVGLIVVEGSGRDWLACLPVTTRLKLRRGHLPVFSTWRQPYGPLGTPLVARSAVESAIEQLMDRLLRESRLGVVALPRLGDDGPVVKGLLAALEARGLRPAHHRSFERAVMRRSTLAGGIEALLSRGHRKDLARLGRRLAEQLGGPLEVRDESEHEAAVDRFLTIEAAGWKGEFGTAFASQPRQSEFFRELCAGFRAAGRLQLLALGADDRAVSMKCNLLTDEAVFCFRIAFDEDFARFRPGLQLELRMLELFHEQMTQSWMDSCSAPNNKLFEHIWPERRQIGSYVMAASGALVWTIEHTPSRLLHAAGS